MENKFLIYPLKEGNGRNHCALWIPEELPSQFECERVLPRNTVFNLVMVEDSNAMKLHWASVVSGWQENISNKLLGRTNVYTFSNLVVLKRTIPHLMPDDLQGGLSTNFSSMIQTIKKRLKTCRETNVSIFIISKSLYNTQDQNPEKELSLLTVPTGKTVSIYILGIGVKFSHHHGLQRLLQINAACVRNSEVITTEENKDIILELAKIGKLLKSVTKLKLSKGGHVLPGLTEKTTSVHCGEWIYLEESQEELDYLSLSVNDSNYILIPELKKPECLGKATCNLFKQWNTALIQQKCNGKLVPKETFDLLQLFYASCKNTAMKQLQGQRERRDIKDYEQEFRKCMNELKMVRAYLELCSEIESEEVMHLRIDPKDFSKTDFKSLCCKRYVSTQYKDDLRTFQNLYEDIRPKIMNLPPPQPDECCRIEQFSTLSDLMDAEEFSKNFHLEKCSFMKSVTISGIPIFSQRRNVSSMNPWAMHIKRILVEPYSVLSQKGLENAAAQNGCHDAKNRSVCVKKDDNETRVNAIIPTIPARVAAELKPIVCSNIFAMMATFCIRKDPYTIDYDVHFAALGCAWLKTLVEFPEENKPEFVTRRLEDIANTAKLYMDRPSFELYKDVLISCPQQALVLESTQTFDKSTNVRCESLVKAAFFLFLVKDSLTSDKVAEIYQLVVFEFFKRCLLKHRRDLITAMPFTDFFCTTLSTLKGKIEWIEETCENLLGNIQDQYNDLLERFYTIDDLSFNLRQDIIELVKSKGKELIKDFPLKPNMKKVRALSNYNTCGDLNWTALQNLASEFGLSVNTVSLNEVFIYIAEILRTKDLKNLTNKDLPSIEQERDTVKDKIILEIQKFIKKGNVSDDINKEWSFEKEVKNQWQESFLKVHSALVKPMTPEQIVTEAQERGIKVCLDTFHEVYRYNANTCLLQNACQIHKCPFYLQPRKNFNQHLSVERKQDNYPHSFHRISKDFCKEGADRVVQELIANRQKQGTGMSVSNSSLPESIEKSVDPLLQLYVNIKGK